MRAQAHSKKFKIHYFWWNIFQNVIQEVLAIRVFWGKGKTVNYKIRELQGILKSAQNRVFLMIFSLKIRELWGFTVNYEDFKPSKKPWIANPWFTRTPCNFKISIQKCLKNRCRCWLPKNSIEKYGISIFLCGLELSFLFSFEKTLSVASEVKGKMLFNIEFKVFSSKLSQKDFQNFNYKNLLVNLVKVVTLVGQLPYPF